MKGNITITISKITQSKEEADGLLTLVATKIAELAPDAAQTGLSIFTAYTEDLPDPVELIKAAIIARAEQEAQQQAQPVQEQVQG